MRAPRSRAAWGHRAAAPLLGPALAAALALSGCTSSSDDPRPPASPGASPQSSGFSATELDGAVSEPVEDRVYPAVGDPSVDALHYDLDLTWTPADRTLTAYETLDFRATADAPSFQLDLAAPLRITALRVDGRLAAYTRRGKDLVVERQVRADRRYRLRVRYTGTPAPVPAPTTRRDIDSLGWTITDDGEVWTMQEPFGAYSWYAVNDQPSDKALYSFTITTPAPGVGVANGNLLTRTEQGDSTTTTWRLDEPAASYLVTVAIGDLAVTEDVSDSGVPLSYWVPPDRTDLLEDLRKTPEALAWVEDRLGPYPFDTLGIVIVDSRSGMETQTMITLGDSDYATSTRVLVHEIVHQWYGDEVTPVDWRDVWMNEGMATYLQGTWEAEQAGVPVERLMDQWATTDQELRIEAGPPADYDPRTFGEGNVYYSPALMWDELRQRIGDDRFWSLVRAWPAERSGDNADYADITTWWSEQTGEDLTSFFDAWLLGRKTPPRT